MQSVLELESGEWAYLKARLDPFEDTQASIIRRKAYDFKKNMAELKQMSTEEKAFCFSLIRYSNCIDSDWLIANDIDYQLDRDFWATRQLKSYDQ